MPSLPHSDTDFYFGDASDTLPNWRETPISPKAEAEAVEEMLGFNPDELWSEEEEGPENSIAKCMEGPNRGKPGPCPEKGTDKQEVERTSTRRKELPIIIPPETAKTLEDLNSKVSLGYKTNAVMSPDGLIHYESETHLEDVPDQSVVDNVCEAYSAAISRLQSLGIDLTGIVSLDIIDEKNPNRAGAYARGEGVVHKHNSEAESAFENVYLETKKSRENGEVPMFAFESLEDRMIHEIAHNLGRKLLADEEAYKEWEGVYEEYNSSVDSLPSFYAQENSSEMWAESVLAIVKGYPFGGTARQYGKASPEVESFVREKLLSSKQNRYKDAERAIVKELPIDHPFPTHPSQENLDPNGLSSEIHEFDELERQKASEPKTSTILLYLARHGDTDRNNPDPSKDRIRAWDDVPLNSAGREEALALEKFFADKDIENPVHSSDLVRTEETAFAIARSKGLDITTTQALRPWDVGKYSGSISSQAHPILEQYVREKSDERLPPSKEHKGESFNEFKDRFLSYLKELFREQEKRYREDPETKPLLLVTHFRNLKAAQAWINNGAPDDLSIDTELFLQWKDLPPGSLIVAEDVGEYIQARVLEQGGVEKHQRRVVTKDKGQPCERGETATRSGCIPASGEAGDGEQSREKTSSKYKVAAITGKELIPKFADLGIEASEDAILDLVGAVSDREVKRLRLHYFESGAYKRWGIDVEGDGYRMEREIRSQGNKLITLNKEFHTDSKGTGIGTETFAKEVESLKKLGVELIVTEASCLEKDGERWNGCYTWARLGYDAPFDEFQKKRLPPEYQEAGTVQQLFRMEGGMAWWKENGWTMNMSFDLKEGSESLKILNAYLKERAKREREANDARPD